MYYQALFNLFVVILLSVIYYKMGTLWGHITRPPRLRWFESLIRFMTRYGKVTASDPAVQRLLDVNADFRIHDVALHGATLSGKVRAYLH